MFGDGIDVDRYAARVNGLFLERPRTVAIVFLVLTAVLAGGMPLIEIGEDDETDAFTDGLPEQEALDAIDDEFGDPFTDPDGSTQLIHSGTNVLSKGELVRSLRVVERADQRGDLRIDGAAGPGQQVAQEIDPSAQTPQDQRETVEGASEREIREAVRSLSDQPQFAGIVSEDFNSQSATASASITAVSHDLPVDADEDEAIEGIQVDMRSIADASDGDIRAFGSGIINDEFGNVIGDSLAIVVPAVVVLILIFLIVAYRDPIDLALGLGALLMTIVWTFGFVGYAGIPFSQQMVSVPVLLLAVGVDFGIHIINRYREERQTGHNRLLSMEVATRQLIVAFFIVTVTTAFGFGANVVSDLGPISDFGLVAAIGIVFTFFIFGIGLPAAKLVADDLRTKVGFPTFGTKPIASEDSPFGRLLSTGARVTKHAPLFFVILFLVIGAGAASYGQDVDQSFDFDDFLPPEELPQYISELPEPFAPGEYTVTRDINFLEDNFEIDQDESVTIYVTGPFADDQALESLQRSKEDPPDDYAVTNREADATSIITVIQDHAEQDPEFRALVDRNDDNGNGIPDRNLAQVYDELFDSASGDRAEEYLTDDRRAAQIEFEVDGDADADEITADSQEYANEFRYEAVPTGQIVVFSAVSDVIFESAIQGMAIAIILTGVFLVIVYTVLEGRPLLGLVNLYPILVTVAVLVATMRAIGLPLNALTATILSITIGVGVAYSVHITHRFIDEYKHGNGTLESMVITLSGTGGALTGSMLTTSIGAGALVLAITPVLGNFGLLMAISVFYSYLTAIFVLPPTLFVWARYDSWDGSLGSALRGAVTERS